MKFFRSKSFHWILGLLGVGGSLFCLFHFSSWRDLVWPGSRIFLLLSGLVILEMFCRSLRVKKVCALIVEKGRRISFWEATWMGSLGDVYGAATPSGIGGEISRLAALARFGIKGSDGVMVLAAERLVLLLSLLFVLIVSGALIFIKDVGALSLHSLFYTLLLYVSLSLGLVVFLLWMIRRRKMPLPWRKLLLKPEIFLLAMVHHIVRLGFLPLVLWIFAGRAPSLSILVWSFILGYGISLFPVPSGGGSVELTFMAIFKPLFGEDLASLVLVWWRFSSHYFYVILSLFIILGGMLRYAKLAKEEEPGMS